MEKSIRIHAIIIKKIDLSNNDGINIPSPINKEIIAVINNRKFLLLISVYNIVFSNNVVFSFIWRHNFLLWLMY